MAELLVSVAIIGLIVNLTTNYFTEVNNRLRSQRAVAVRDQLVATIRRLAGMPATLRSSVALNDNPDVLPCLTQDNADDCTSGVALPLKLYGPVIEESWVIIQKSGMVAGPEPTLYHSVVGELPPVVRYDGKGFPCPDANAPSETCPFVVYASVVPQCGIPPPPPGGPVSFTPRPTCDVADVLQVRYRVEQLPGVYSMMPIASVVGFVSIRVFELNAHEPWP